MEGNHPMCERLQRRRFWYKSYSRGEVCRKIITNSTEKQQGQGSLGMGILEMGRHKLCFRCNHPLSEVPLSNCRDGSHSQQSSFHCQEFLEINPSCSINTGTASQGGRGSSLRKDGTCATPAITAVIPEPLHQNSAGKQS